MKRHPPARRVRRDALYRERAGAEHGCCKNCGLPLTGPPNLRAVACLRCDVAFEWPEVANELVTGEGLVAYDWEAEGTA